MLNNSIIPDGPEAADDAKSVIAEALMVEMQATEAVAKKDYAAKVSLRTVAGLSGACTLSSRRIRAVNLLIGS